MLAARGGCVRLEEGRYDIYVISALSLSWEPLMTSVLVFLRLVGVVAADC